MAADRPGSTSGFRISQLDREVRTAVDDAGHRVDHALRVEVEVGTLVIVDLDGVQMGEPPERLGQFLGVGHFGPAPKDR